ncbi:DUF2231 domain-containing protein [Falsiroseomonas sp. HW251]|uniref:DUF2231 domain-containing protein n=1 Tax=Falsiroseomonas sp. HW251 TaxID=3390998 RepID=UPI003D321528
MSATTLHAPARPLHPLHAMLLAFPLPLFLGAFLADLAYWRSFEVQWANFASWMIAGALLVGGFAVLWALVDAIRRRTGRAVLYLATLAAMWLLGLVNAFVHGKDAWAIMPEALWLSGLVSLLAIVAFWLAHARRAGDAA